MNRKLQQGDYFPSISFGLTNAENITIPDDITTKYAAVIFYRGHW
jgi:hypothetical protein